MAVTKKLNSLRNERYENFCDSMCSIDDRFKVIDGELQFITEEATIALLAYYKPIPHMGSLKNKKNWLHFSIRAISNRASIYAVGDNIQIKRIKIDLDRAYTSASAVIKKLKRLPS